MERSCLVPDDLCVGTFIRMPCVISSGICSALVNGEGICGDLANPIPGAGFDVLLYSCAGGGWSIMGASVMAFTSSISCFCHHMGGCLAADFLGAYLSSSLGGLLRGVVGPWIFGSGVMRPCVLHSLSSSSLW
ncbi:hypothetical protein Dimus_031142 [Dionaea muscipula]